VGKECSKHEIHEKKTYKIVVGQVERNKQSRMPICRSEVTIKIKIKKKGGHKTVG
jgi:hypothetical protein